MISTERIREMITELGDENQLSFPIGETIDALKELVTLREEKNENKTLSYGDWAKQFPDAKKD